MVQIVRRDPNKAKPKSILERFKMEIEPEEYDYKPLNTRIAIFDSETDPFATERIVEPFTCGFYMTDTKEYVDFWGDNCIDQFIEWLDKFPPETFSIFAHNGGNFDFYFLTDYFDKGQSPFIINGRLVRVLINGQEFRDSYAMIPVALGEYQKTEIDYRCMERGFREIYKDTIREYQKDDCIFLADLVCNWLDMFGNRLTMASVALPMLRSYQGFDTLSPHHDAEMRPYYFGGRNQCFGTGILRGDFKIYDINSSYPNVMKRFKHPISSVPNLEAKITDRTHFAYIRAWSNGALPVRGKQGLEFPRGIYDFYACKHEIEAGLETNTLDIKKVYHTIWFDEEADFSAFIDEFYKLRLEAKGRGDKIRTLFYKLVMNSSYGKFAQDPRRYQNWQFDPNEIPTPSYCEPCSKLVQLELPYTCSGEKGACSPYGWTLHTSNNGVNIYNAPQRIRTNSFFNVATAASITSAARANLLRGIQAASRPVYCDTDSVICEALNPSPFNGIELDPHNLGAWDIEAEGDTLAIAGKKLYAILHSDYDIALAKALKDQKTAKDVETINLPHGKFYSIKKASKGVKLTASQICRVAMGETISYSHPVPKFRFGKEPLFTERVIKATG